MSESVPRILVIRRRYLGDLVLLGPVLHSPLFCNVKVDQFGKRVCHWVLRDCARPVSICHVSLSVNGPEGAGKRIPGIVIWHMQHDKQCNFPLNGNTGKLQVPGHGLLRPNQAFPPSDGTPYPTA